MSPRNKRIMVGLGAEQKGAHTRMCVEREILTVVRSLSSKNRRKKKVGPKASPLPKTSSAPIPAQNAWNNRAKKSIHSTEEPPTKHLKRAMHLTREARVPLLPPWRRKARSISAEVS